MSILFYQIITASDDDDDVRLLLYNLFYIEIHNTLAICIVLTYRLTN